MDNGLNNILSLVIGTSVIITNIILSYFIHKKFVKKLK